MTDTATGLVCLLDGALVDELVRLGYVAPEARLAGRTAARARREQRASRLFAARDVRPPKPPLEVYPDAKIEPTAVSIVEGWQRIFLRLRLARGTQSQFPLPVVRAIRRRLRLPTLDGPVPVVLRNEDRRQEITPTYPVRGNKTVPNTYKFEAFAAREHALAKVEVIGNTAFVEQIDSAEAVGRSIEQYLLDGLTSGATIQTRRKIEQATLYRFD